MQNEVASGLGSLEGIDVGSGNVLSLQICPLYYFGILHPKFIMNTLYGQTHPHLSLD